MHGTLTDAFSPAPILEAVAAYRGTVVGLGSSAPVAGPELHAAAGAVASWLKEHDVAPGDRVMFSVGNGPQFIAALCGVLAADATPVVLHADTPGGELHRSARRLRARFVLSEACGLEPLGAVGLAASGFEHAGWLKFALAEVPVDANAPDYPMLSGVPLHPTSGTTGTPKVAVRPALAAVAEAQHYIDTMSITADDTILCVVPLSHAYGYGMGFMVSMLSGARLVTLRQFNPRHIQRALAEERVTIFPAVPAMLDLVNAAGGGGGHLPRLVLAAGAPLRQSTAEAFRQRTGIPVTPLYGTTETGGISVGLGEVDLATGCVGRPMEGVEAKLVAIADSPELAEGVGRLHIRSSSMMTGYLADGCVDELAFRDGWFESGDLARIDDAGRIHLVGREKEMINVFGMKVVPSEVEEVILALPQVREVKVYASAHRSGSEIVTAAVAGDDGLDAAAVRRHCELHLVPYKRPQVVHVIDALPRSPVGKILRDQLP